MHLSCESNEKFAQMKLYSTDCFTDLDKFKFVKFAYVGLVLGESQFLLLSQLSQKMMLVLRRLVKRDSKIIFSLGKSKSVIHSIHVQSV